MSMRTPRQVPGGLTMSRLTMHEIDTLVELLLTERVQRAVADADPDTLVDLAMRELFDSTSGPKGPRVMAPGLVALPGMVHETSATRHRCVLFTVKVPGGAHTWSWDDEGSTFVHGDASKVGKTLWSVNLHQAVPGVVYVMHTRNKVDDRHVSTAVAAYEAHQEYDEETGEVGATTLSRIPDWTPSHLPPPKGEEDQRSYTSRQGSRNR